MNPLRSRFLAAALGASVVSLSIAPVALAQPAAKKGRAAADPEGTPPSRAVPDSVKVVRDLVYARYGEREVKLDLYLPRQPAAAKIPCIVVVHGGGWRSGDKTRFAHIAGALAAQGFAAACIGYRLLPEVQFPAPVLDCKAAVRWVRANAAAHGIDPDRLGALGGSAGGHLVAMLGTSAHVASLEGEGGSPGSSSRVQAVVAMATPADLVAMGNRVGLDAELARLISPVTHVSAASAPMLLLHGTADTLVPMAQSELLLEKYRAAGVKAELVKIEGGVHAFWNGTHFEKTIALAVPFFRAVLAPASDAKK